MKSRFILLIALACCMAGCKTNQYKAQEAKEAENIATAHNSENSLDWNGIYRGTMPCADCEGIEMEIKLNRDLTYSISRKYLGKSDEVYRQKGNFRWDGSGNKVTLMADGEEPETNQYQVGENQLIKLDSDGKRIQGEFSGMYTLEKVDFDQKITEKYWKLIELRGEKITFSENQIREAHFIVKDDNDKVIGNGGCNSFTGTYEMAAGNSIRFSKMASTRMACMNTGYENEYLRVLEEVDNYTIKGDTLSLSKARMAPLAKFVAVYLR